MVYLYVQKYCVFFLINCVEWRVKEQLQLSPPSLHSPQPESPRWVSKGGEDKTRVHTRTCVIHIVRDLLRILK